MLHRFVVLICLLTVGQMLFSSHSKAQDAAPLVRMLKSGRLPPERIGNVLNLVFQRGNAEDLGYLFARAADPAGFP
ncbi:MAG: hypothetical protein JNG90_02910, partial [Planctomycetaceae bacterium]|nr:hypothetical protein [Planctomycetaceae bacterium]